MTTARQSQRLKKAFLAHFADYGNITAGARHVGIDRTTVYWWQEHDEEFAAAFRDAEVQATEMLEVEARRRAVEGVVTVTPNYHRGELLSETVETKYSDTLLIFLLKARSPEKYRERVGLEHSGPGGIPIQTEDVSLSDNDRATRILAIVQRARERAAGPAHGPQPDLDAPAGAADGSMAL